MRSPTVNLRKLKRLENAIPQYLSQKQRSTVVGKTIEIQACGDKNGRRWCVIVCLRMFLFADPEKGRYKVCNPFLGHLAHSE